MEAYREWYADYYQRHLSAETAAFAMDPPGPRVVLVPGVAMITSGTNASKADLANELYHRAIQVIGLCSSVSEFTTIDEAEAFNVEYWPLERYKLSLSMAPRELDGRVALVTGAASGIGRATAELLASEGAHVAIADINDEGARAVANAITDRHGPRRSLAVAMDVCDEESVRDGFERTVLEWGGIDILVSNAGPATSAPLTETTLGMWDRTFDVLARGYFLVARSAVDVMRSQGVGGSIVFVGSKNAIVAGKMNAAYSAAKAAELHLARCIAEEAGGDGIRLNVVNPDAVLAGSGIWDSEWRRERAANYGIDESELDHHYRERTTLKVSVFPEDVAQAVLHFASDRSSKSTGNMLNVDGGVAAAYPR